MEELLIEFLAETGALVGYAVLTVILTVLGLLAELSGLQTVGSGSTVMAGWFAAVGLLLLVGAGLLVRDKLLPAWRAREA